MMKKDADSTGEARGHPVYCAYCRAEIKGTPYEKNGFVYDSESHTTADDKRPPRT